MFLNEGVIITYYANQNISTRVLATQNTSANLVLVPQLLKKQRKTNGVPFAPIDFDTRENEQAVLEFFGVLENQFSRMQAPYSTVRAQLKNSRRRLLRIKIVG